MTSPVLPYRGTSVLLRKAAKRGKVGQGICDSLEEGNPAMARKKRETADEAHQRFLREVLERAARRQKELDHEVEAAWANLRAAIDRGEITREELLGASAAPVAADPIRLTIGSTTLEVILSASIREVPAEPAKPAKPAEVIAFPKKRAAGE